MAMLNNQMVDPIGVSNLSTKPKIRSQYATNLQISRISGFCGGEFPNLRVPKGKYYRFKSEE
jgi:hypothetical protein